MVNFEKVKVEKKESLGERLEKVLATTAEEINQQLKQCDSEQRNIRYVDSSGQIEMTAFKIKHGGPYAQEEIRHDQQTVNNCLDSWGGLYSPEVQRRYEQKAGKKLNSEELRLAYQKEQNKKEGHLTEVVITILLHRYLQDRLIVMRTSPYDDYQGIAGQAGRVDHLLIDKKSGKVICTFDDVEVTSGGRLETKQEKIKKIARSGGANIKYGFSLSSEEQGKKLVRSSLHNVPAFYLQMSKESLQEMIEEICNNTNNQPTEKELLLASSLMGQLQQQAAQMLKEDDGLPTKLKQNLLVTQELFNGI